MTNVLFEILIGCSVALERESAMTREINIALVGDSDISRWPLERLPSIGLSVDTIIASPMVSGHSGATLEEILPHVKETIDRLLDRAVSSPSNMTSFIIICAGENDIGSGIPQVRSNEVFRSILDLFLEKDGPEEGNPLSLYCIFLGPKFEPWLANDMEARKSYVRMSQSFERISQALNCDKQHSPVNGICYVDCLTMFCGDSSKQPGAVLGGKAMPQPQYFETDQLHLSDEGYKIWQTVVEGAIRQILLPTTNNSHCQCANDKACSLDGKR